MKIYLLLVDDEQFFFYSDDSETEPSEDLEASSAPSGMRGLLERKWHSFQNAWNHADAGVALRVRRIWDWLHTLTHPDETMLVRLRSARQIELNYPASRQPDLVASIWRDYLRRRFYRHIVFAVLNGTMAIPTIVLLWPLPGPNIIGYWFAYRMIHHLLILRGIRKVRKGIISTVFHAVPSLDLPVSRGLNGKASHEAIEGEGKRLDDFLTRAKPRGNMASPLNQTGDQSRAREDANRRSNP